MLQVAQELEQRVRRVAAGWEADLGLAVDSMFPGWLLEPDIRAISTVAPNTRLGLHREALSGTWEALLNRRVDLVVAAGEGPCGGGYVAEPLGTVAFAFAVAPTHPLAKLGRVTAADLADHRAIAVGDSARRRLPGFLLATASEDARRIVEEADVLRFTAEDQMRFAKALIDPPAPNAKLTRAAKRHADLIVPR